jgi:hypothetical protein
MSRKTTLSIIGVVISIALLYLSVRNVDFGSVRNSFADADFRFAAATVVFLAIFFWLKAMRWRDILSPIDHFSSASLFPSMISGAACNNLLPAHLGEIVRVYLLSHEFSIPKTTVLATLIVERIFDAVAVLLLITVALSMLKLDAQFHAAALFLAAVAGVGLAVTYLTARFPDAAVRIVKRSFFFLPTRSVDRLCLLVSHLCTGLAALRDPRLFVLILGNSIVQWLAMVVCVYFAIVAFDIRVPPYAAILVLALIVAGVSLPTSPGFVGTIQFCFVLGLKQFGIDANSAFAASVFYHSITFVAVTATGLYFMHRYRLKLRSAYTIGLENDPDEP